MSPTTDAATHGKRAEHAISALSQCVLYPIVDIMSQFAQNILNS